MPPPVPVAAAEEGSNSEKIAGEIEEDTSSSSPSSSYIVPPGLDSGDIVLFSRACLRMSVYGALICAASKAFSNSEWDHVGVVVAGPGPGELRLLEANLNGVTSYPLSDRLARTRSNAVAIRRLSAVRTPALRARLLAFEKAVVGVPYERNMLSLVRAAVDPPAKKRRERLTAQRLGLAEQLASLDAALGERTLTRLQRLSLQTERDTTAAELAAIDALLASCSPSAFDSEEDLSAVFCSELTAAAYQALGLLGSFPASSGYVPKDWSSQQQPSNLHLLGSARLGDEEYVRGGPKDKSGVHSKSIHSGSLDQPPHGAARELVARALSHTIVWARIREDKLREQLIDSFRPFIVPKGGVVFHEGDYGDAMYVVESGTVERLVVDESDSLPGQRLSVAARLEEGGVFGTSTVVGLTAQRIATLRASDRTDVFLWRAPRAAYSTALHAQQQLAKQTRTSSPQPDDGHDGELREWEQEQLAGYLAEHFLFRGMLHAELRQLSGAFFPVSLRAGETLFQQGDVGDNFYVVASGEVAMTVHHPSDGDNGFTLVTTLRDGESFGELALMFDTPRGATVTAKRDTRMWAISGEAFHHGVYRSAHVSRTTLHKIFNANASFTDGTTGERYMTVADFRSFLRGSGREARDDVIIDMASKLAASNRDPSKALISFMEFTRFDTLMNHTDSHYQIAFQLADRTNKGFIDAPSFDAVMAPYWEDERERLYCMRMLFGRPHDRLLSYTQFKQKAQPGELLPRLFAKNVGRMSDLTLSAVGTLLESVPTSADQPAAAFVMVEHLRAALPAWHVASVSLASVAAATAVAPVERVRLLLQVRKGKALRSALAAIRADRLLTGLYRGNGVNMLRVLPAAALQLVIYEAATGAHFATAPKHLDRERLPAIQAAAAGALAGTIATIATYPLDTARTRVAVSTSTLSVLRKAGMWRGLGPTLLGAAPMYAVHYCTYEVLRPLLPRLNDGSGRPTREALTAAALLASALAQLAVYPLDTIRHRMQAGAVVGNRVWAHASAVAVAKHVWREEGILGYYRGAIPNLVKLVPSALVAYYAYENMRSMFRPAS
eukprot:jgi/Chlat1/5768/Chrsp387S00874